MLTGIARRHTCCTSVINGKAAQQRRACKSALDVTVTVEAGARLLAVSSVVNEQSPGAAPLVHQHRQLCVRQRDTRLLPHGGF